MKEAQTILIVYITLIHFYKEEPIDCAKEIYFPSLC